MSVYCHFSQKKCFNTWAVYMHWFSQITKIIVGFPELDDFIAVMRMINPVTIIVVEDFSR